MPLPTERLIAEISLAAVERNVDFFRNETDGKKIFAVLKAACYGHGESFIPYALDLTDGAAVATAEEGLTVRRYNKVKPVLILGFVPEKEMPVAIENDLSLSVFSYEYACFVNAVARNIGKKAKVHVKINSGMNRLGFSPFSDDLKRLFSLKNLIFEGIFSHYAVSEKENKPEFEAQTEIFNAALGEAPRYADFEFVHMSSTRSASKNSLGNAVRIGYGLYGYGREGLMRALSLRAAVVQTHTLEKGESIGYDYTFTAKETLKTATIAVGYGDGYPRALSNKGKVLYKGVLLPIIGKICMDMTSIEITNSDVKTGDYVTLIGSDNGKTITAETLGFGYETLCRLAERVKKIIISTP